MALTNDQKRAMIEGIYTAEWTGPLTVPVSCGSDEAAYDARVSALQEYMAEITGYAPLLAQGRALPGEMRVTAQSTFANVQETREMVEAVGEALSPEDQRVTWQFSFHADDIPTAKSKIAAEYARLVPQQWEGAATSPPVSPYVNEVLPAGGASIVLPKVT